MPKTIVERLADFTVSSHFENLPGEVTRECKRIVLDSIGCAVAATGLDHGRMGIAFARRVGAGTQESTVIGTSDRLSVFGAAFANAELITTLDMDCVVPPGHVTPYVLPGILAVGESLGASGKEVITAVAISHEMSLRFGKAMDTLRDTKDGKANPPKVFGFTSSIFGGTAAIGRLMKSSREIIANSLGIAGSISPVNSQVAWSQHAPSSTIKGTAAGVLAHQILTAAQLGELGHRGDLRVLDDSEFGYARFIGTSKWEPEHLVNGLGQEWLFPSMTSYKSYAHCRVMHGSMDCVIEIVDQHDIRPEEIEAIKVYVEGFTEQPVWLNRKIERVHDAVFSMAHGIAMSAHRPAHGRAWLDSQLVFSRSVMALMDKVTTEVHPDYAQLLAASGSSRPAWVELRARGQTFVRRKLYPKGSRSPEPGTYMTDDELIGKFRRNTEGVLSPSSIDGLIDAILNLDGVADVARTLPMAGDVCAPLQIAAHVP